MSNLTEYGYAKDGKIYLNAYMGYPAREIGVVRESEEASLQYFINRFELARKKADDLKNAVLTTPNKGSYLMKLIHMRTYLAEFDGLGDFPSLFAILDELEADIRVYVQDNRKKNYDIKQELLKEVHELTKASNWNLVTKKLKELKLRWIKTGSAYEEHEGTMNDEFDQVYNGFFERKASFFAERQQKIEQRMTRYEQLIDEARQVNQAPPENAFQVMKGLEKSWKVVGKVPAKKFKDYNKAFRDELNKFFNQLKRARVTYKNPIDRKKELCERVEQLVDLGDPPIDEVKSIQAEWKRLGQLKHPADKDYNTRFKIACNEIFENHFLAKSAHSKYEQFEEKTKFEQLKIKIRLLKESIKQDENELSLMNERDGSANRSYNRDRNSTDKPPIDMEKLNHINKLKTKQRILKKLQDQLLTNY